MLSYRYISIINVEHAIFMNCILLDYLKTFKNKKGFFDVKLRTQLQGWKLKDAEWQNVSWKENLKNEIVKTQIQPTTQLNWIWG